MERGCGASIHDERTYLACLFRSRFAGVRVPPHTFATRTHTLVTRVPRYVGEAEPLGHGRAARTPIFDAKSTIRSFQFSNCKLAP